jgi:hypothetical protein
MVEEVEVSRSRGVQFGGLFGSIILVFHCTLPSFPGGVSSVPCPAFSRAAASGVSV